MQNLTVTVGKTEVVVEVPEMFQLVADLLPVIQQYFGANKVKAVLADSLFKQVGGSYKKQAWINRVIKHHHMIEDEDYTVFIMDVNDPANAAEVARNRGAAPTRVYFTPQAAVSILANAGTLEASKLAKYMYWLTDAGTPAFLRFHEEIVAKKDLIIASKNRAIEAEGAYAVELARLSGHNGNTTKAHIRANELRSEEVARQTRDAETIEKHELLLERIATDGARYLEKKDLLKLKEVFVGVADQVKRMKAGDVWCAHYK